MEEYRQVTEQKEQKTREAEQLAAKEKARRLAAQEALAKAAEQVGEEAYNHHIDEHLPKLKEWMKNETAKAKAEHMGALKVEAADAAAKVHDRHLAKHAGNVARYSTVLADQLTSKYDETAQPELKALLQQEFKIADIVDLQNQLDVL